MKNRLERIIKNELCLGCGLCETLGKDQDYKMELKANGFYYPQFPSKRNKKLEKVMSTACPGVNIFGDNSKEVWGNIVESYTAWSNDPDIRYKSSSGGIITSICIHLLEKKDVDAVLHIGNINTHYLYNHLHISRNRNEVLNNASSRYAPALILNEFAQILNSTTDIFCFVGKPCDILAVKNYFALYPHYSKRIKYFIALFCAGIPSYNATLKLLEQAKMNGEPLSIKYRGDGWPGSFKATYKENIEFKVAYDESWGKVLGRNIHFRCKICPDSIGLLADFSVGDAWEIVNGAPDFSEREGRSFVLARNANASKVFRNILESKNISVEHFEFNDLYKIQPYQYQRRLLAGYRLLTIHFMTAFLFKLYKLNLISLMRKMSFSKGIKNAVGVLKRSLQRIHI